MVNIYKPKRKCRMFFGTVTFPLINPLLMELLVVSVIIATIHVPQVNAMLGGNGVLKDEWPFIAALYNSRTSKFFCGGTIISHKHILTAAHCIQSKSARVSLSPSEITVRLGGYNLTDRSETDAVDRSITKIHVHPDWKADDEKYDADVAILVLNENIKFSNHIRGVSMPPHGFSIGGLKGTVVGYGRTENGTVEGIPRKFEIDALNDTYCYETDMGIARFASERMFCGEGSGSPSNGDAGGGFFAAADSHSWIQFGIISVIRPKATGNRWRMGLYTKVTSFRDWIAEIVEQSGNEISLATTQANLTCTYGYTGAALYGCWLFDVNIRLENFEVENFSGSHYFGKDNEDVELVTFKTDVMASLPRNLGNHFKNLKFLVISLDTRRFARSNFQYLEHLVMIGLVDSNVEELDKDSLWDLPNLQSFELDKSKLRLLHAATFSRNYKLSIVNVLSSTLKSLPRKLFRKNVWLESVSFDDNLIESIDENIFEANANLRAISFKGNRLRHLSKKLFQHNSELLTVDLSSNNIKTIDEQSFQANSKLLSLHLESNELEFLPAQLLRGMAFLEEFNADKNLLKVIDEQFFETNVRIKEIHLQSNQLKRIPANLFRNNGWLQIVHLGANSIESVDENLFEGNSLLQTVSFESNRFVELPANLFRHNAMLEFINVRWNLLETIDEQTFEWNTRLREINFGSNDVKFLPGKLFQNNSLLESVHFDVNSLETIDEDIFQANANLQSVYLASNLLDRLPKNLFRNNPLLEIVDLSNNFFTTLDQNIFNENVNLRKVSLHGGILKSLPRNLFQNNSRLQYVDLSGNMLKSIATNFTVLRHVSRIDLSENVCIDTAFYGDNGDAYLA